MTTEVANPATPTINVSERAAKKILALFAKDGVSPEQGGLRIGVQGGGCSGLSYAMRLDTQSARPRQNIRGIRRPRLRRPEKPLIPERHYARVRRNADAPGIRVRKSQCRKKLRLRQFIYGLSSTDFCAMELGPGRVRYGWRPHSPAICCFWSEFQRYRGLVTK